MSFLFQSLINNRYVAYFAFVAVLVVNAFVACWTSSRICYDMGATRRASRIPT
ncbi:MAG: hypothetical protein IPH49_14700 [Ignavibacteria bacterium]|nr:hypothetical protein [Ignavibacteria bacterium]